ncbi:MAG: class I SAM-dependent methyltransferase [Solirubrobacterales bacterium]
MGAEHTAPHSEQLRSLLTPAARSVLDRALAADPHPPFWSLTDPGRTDRGFTQRMMHRPALAGVYERWWRPLWTQAFTGVNPHGLSSEIDRARQQLHLEPGSTVLDVGCGPATFTRVLATEVGHDGLAVGLDPSVAMLEQGARQVANGPELPLVLVRGRAESLPFADDSFDAVCCFGTLYLMDEPEQALDEMTRVIRPGGRLALMASARRAIPHPIVAPLRTVTGIRLFDGDELESGLADRGIDIEGRQVDGLVQELWGELAER